MNLDTKDVQVGNIVRKEENSDTAYIVEKIENDTVTLKDKSGNVTTASTSSLYAASEEQIKSFDSASQIEKDYSQGVTDPTATSISDTTLEINPTGIDDACSFWNQKIASENLESVNVESAFEALTSQGIATAYIPSLKNALSKVTSLASQISSTIENAKNEQVSVDEASKSKNENNNRVLDYTPTKSSDGSSNRESISSRGSRTKNNSSTSEVSSSSNVSSSVNNNDKNIEINTDAIKALNNMDYANYDVFLKGLTSIISENATLEIYLQNEQYADLLKEKLSSISGLSDDIKQIISKMDPKTLQITLQNWYTDTSVVTDTTKNIVYNYTEALAKSSNTSVNDFIKNSGKTVVSSFQDTHDIIDKMIKTGTVQENLLKIYDGNETGNINETTASIVRNIIDEVAKKNNISSEAMLTDESKSKGLNEEMTKISRSLAYVKSLNSLSSTNITNALESILK